METIAIVLLMVAIILGLISQWLWMAEARRWKARAMKAEAFLPRPGSLR